MRIQVQALYYKTWSIQAGSGSSKQVWHGQDTRIVLRQAWVGDRQTKSRGLGRENNPGARAESEHRENRETLGKVAGLNNTRQ